MDELIEVLAQNSWAALGFGIVAGIYAIGKIDPFDDGVDKSDFNTVDEELAYLKRRQQILETLKREGTDLEGLVLKLMEEVKELKEQSANG